MDIEDIKKVYFLNEKEELCKIIPKSRRRGGSVIRVNFKSNDKDGYSILTFKGYPIKSHRLVMSLKLDRILSLEEHVDHKDGNKLNNFPKNLRVVSNRGNHSNRKTHREGKLVGTRKTKNGFTAQLRIGADNVYLGAYETELEAHEIYNKALSSQHKYEGNSRTFREMLGYNSKRQSK